MYMGIHECMDDSLEYESMSDSDEFRKRFFGKQVVDMGIVDNKKVRCLQGDDTRRH